LENKQKEERMKKIGLAVALLVIALISIMTITSRAVALEKVKVGVGTSTCLNGICSPERTQGLKAPVPKGEYELVTLKGPGTFISAEISKQGGTNDLTFIILDIDGKNVVDLSVAALKNLGLTQDNPYGLVLLESEAGIKTLTIGYPFPLNFSQELKLKVTVNENNVQQIVANVVHGK
jgi:hypothetical protein